MQLNNIYHLLKELLLQGGVSKHLSDFVTSFILLLGLIILLLAIDFVVNKVLVFLADKVIRRSTTKIDDILLDHKALDYVIHFIPLSIAKWWIPVVFMNFPKFIVFCQTIIDVFIIAVSVLFFHALVKASLAVAKTMRRYQGRPIDGFFQIITIGLYIIGALVIIGRIFQTDPVQILTAIGATSAVVILVFKDTILGIVASVQISTNDMVRLGDWIEMNKFGADGVVVKINLNTVKVENFDKTITTIPTHFLITDSFRNYRNMFASGGRRIKRSVQIKINSVRFLSEQEIEKLKEIVILQDFIAEKQRELSLRSEAFAPSPHPINVQAITNISLFRYYFEEFVRRNNLINKDYFLMVRQLQSSHHGIPLELYAFSTNTQLVEYEAVASDIFDHILSCVRYFHLEVFEVRSDTNQNPDK